MSHGRLMFLTRCLLVAWIAISAARAQITQVTNTTSIPVPGSGHDYIKLFNESVNPANGSVSLRIELPVPQARGFTIPVAYTYNSNQVGHFGRLPGYALGYISWLSDDPNDGTEEGGWSLVGSPMVSDYHAQRTTSYPPSTNYVCNYTTDYVFRSPNGERHNLNLSWAPNDQGCQNQSPPMFIYTSGGDPVFKADLDAALNLVVSDAEGRKYNFGNGLNDGNDTCDCSHYAFASIEDRNGNQMGPGDTLRRITASGTFGTANHTNPTATNRLTITGLQNPYVMQWQSVGAAHYGTNPTPVGPNNQYCTVSTPNTANGPATGVQFITLPNGKKFQFTYDSAHGLLNQIVYPSGAVVTYTWNLNSNSEFLVWPDSQGASQGCEYRYGTAAVTKRTVSFDGASIALEQDFTYQTTWDPQNFWSWSQKTTTVVTKDCARSGSCSSAPSFTTVYTYVGCACTANDPNDYPTFGGPQIPLENTITYKDWNGSVLRTVTKNFSNPFQLNSVKTQTENGLVSETDYAYAPQLILEPKEIDDYDWGSGAKGTLLRKRTVSYFDYSAWRIYDAVKQISTYNGSGTLVAQTNYSYDQTAVGPTSNVTNHDYTNYGSTFVTGRRNPTTVTLCLIASGACANGSPTSTYAYDDTGQLISMTDPCGNATCADMPTGAQHTTTYSYADSYSSGTPPGQTNGYLTSITDALGHASTFTYSYLDGLLTASSDPNKRSTSYKYNTPPSTCTYSDELDRLSEIDYPDGGQTTYCYEDALHTVQKTTVIDNTTTPPWSTTSMTVLNGLDETIQVQLVSDPQGTDFTDTTYDGSGLVWKQSNAHRSSSSTTDGTTTHLYDALGRLCLTVPADVTTVRTSCPTSAPLGDVFTSYSGNCTTVTDEAGKVRTSCVDGLGRITKVIEDPNGLKYETDYAYDALNNLICAVQKGTDTSPFTTCSAAPGTWRPRSFVYDSLSRLVCASNPENSSAACTSAALTGYISGTTGYNYDANGNASSRTAPLHNQTGTATVATNYQYDALNRIVSKTYTDGTPSVQHGYDGSTLTGCGTAPPSLSDPYPIGRRTVMCDGSGATSWAHDSMGRIATETRTIKGSSAITKSTSYVYNVDGSLNELTYPSGTILNYAYDQAQRQDYVADLVHNITYAYNATFAPPGLMTGYIAGQTATFAGITPSAAYNNRLQPTAISANTPSSTIFSLGYTYPAGQNNGNISTITNNLDATRTVGFNYDSLNRIANAATTNWGETYTIDAWGNMTGIGSYQGKASESLNCGPANTKNQLNTCFVYDSAGNLITKLPAHYTYDGENRLAVTAGWTYVYDGDGNRVRKFNSATGTLYWRATDGEVLGETDQAGTPTYDYVFFNGRRIARFDVTPKTAHYYFSDHLGTHSLVTNAVGKCEQDLEFYPYGGERQEHCSTKTAQHYKFTGKERDAESGLDNFGARYDSSSMGRFMTPDPGNFAAHRLNPQSWNAYSYAHNRPLTLVDPNGLEPVKAQVGTIHGFAQSMNNTQHHVGQMTGAAATQALQRLGETEGFAPKNTVFNNANRYIYTANGGWVDMLHFVFYAGRAATHKAEGDSNPVGSAVQEGFHQELMDTFRAPWSAYSYEDLPSDRLGAIFGAQYFDPTSSLTLAEQMELFFELYLVPMPATSAPNYANIPMKDSRNAPTATNHTTNPMYTYWWSSAGESARRSCVTAGGETTCESY